MTSPVRHRIRSRIASVLLVSACFSPLHADPPASATYSYDDLGRLRTGEFSDGRKADYQYDPAGNRTTMTSGSPPELSIGAAASVTEGNNLLFPVTKTGTSSQNITVRCVPQNGTAQGAPTGATPPFDDYLTTSQVITFFPGDPSPTTKNCAIATKTDGYYEGTQTLTATLQDASAGTVITPPGVAPGSILDGNTPPNFTVAGSSSPEGNTVSFTITRNGFTEQSHSVSHATSNGSATTTDNDYTAVSPTALSFPSTTTASHSRQISIATSPDSKFEAAETFTVSLSAPSNAATLGSPSSATGTINNNDAAPTIAINDPLAVNEGQQRTFIVQKVGNTNTAFTHGVSWSTSNGTATAGSDYTAASGTVTFGTSETSKTISVQTLTDGVYEGGGVETFTVNLSTNASTNGAQISSTDGSGAGVIADIDNPVPAVPIMNSPAFRQDTDGNFGVDWSDSTGPVAYYVLEEENNGGGTFTSFTPYNVTAPTSFKSFSNKDSGEWRYRVKACSSGGTCSGYSGVAMVLVCVGGCQ